MDSMRETFLKFSFVRWWQSLHFAIPQNAIQYPWAKFQPFFHVLLLFVSVFSHTDKWVHSQLLDDAGDSVIYLETAQKKGKTNKITKDCFIFSFVWVKQFDILVNIPFHADKLAIQAVMTPGLERLREKDKTFLLKAQNKLNWSVTS